MESRERVVKALNKLIKALAVIWLVLIVLRLIWYFADITYIFERLSIDTTDVLSLFLEQTIGSFLAYSVAILIVALFTVVLFFLLSSIITVLIAGFTTTISEKIEAIFVKKEFGAMQVNEEVIEASLDIDEEIYIDRSKRKISVFGRYEKAKKTDSLLGAEHRIDGEFFIFKCIKVKGEKLYLPYSLIENRYVNGYVVGKNISYYCDGNESERMLLVDAIKEEIIENEKEHVEEKICGEILAEKCAKAAAKLIKSITEESFDTEPRFKDIVLTLLVTGVFLITNFVSWLISKIASSEINLQGILWIINIMILVLIIVLYVVKRFYEKEKPLKFDIEIDKVHVIFCESSEGIIETVIKEKEAFVKDEYIVLVKKGDEEGERFLGKLKEEKEKGLYEVRLIYGTKKESKIKYWVKLRS
ncbi:hypothetical protein [Caldicellulosiruptor acetigenus]|uniref:Uncharacterized protein n=1 Tax=Caldicellulosiruptor acetigenus 6A TaxID=632516 RepID=G2PXH1_9FIRM|nr:hypothetical protein [Caldicellulosiruptor acetigenus]AEM74835.1 hypothetical protein Calla_2300 [Caldicellulosiruptor acetigenus 6A]